MEGVDKGLLRCISVLKQVADTILLEERGLVRKICGLLVVSEVSSGLTGNYSGFNKWFRKFLKVPTLKIPYLQLEVGSCVCVGRGLRHSGFLMLSRSLLMGPT